MSLKRIYKGGTGEIVEKKSRFIASVFNIESEEEALDIIAKVKKQYWDARHNCSAFVCGSNNEISRFSDDGEPSGTAGKPMLDVIAGSGIRNCLVVVTRYFGGTLLGTGGLIRAYQSATKVGIEASTVIEVMQGKKRIIQTDYNNVGKLQYLCAAEEVSVLNTDYGADVTIELLIKEENFNSFEKKLTETFAGNVHLEGDENVQFALIDGRAVEM